MVTTCACKRGRYKELVAGLPAFGATPSLPPSSILRPPFSSCPQASASLLFTTTLRLGVTASLLDRFGLVILTGVGDQPWETSNCHLSPADLFLVLITSSNLISVILVLVTMSRHYKLL